MEIAMRESEGSEVPKALSYPVTSAHIRTTALRYLTDGHRSNVANFLLLINSMVAFLSLPSL